MPDPLGSTHCGYDFCEYDFSYVQHKTLAELISEEIDIRREKDAAVLRCFYATWGSEEWRALDGQRVWWYNKWDHALVAIERKKGEIKKAEIIAEGERLLNAADAEFKEWHIRHFREESEEAQSQFKEEREAEHEQEHLIRDQEGQEDQEDHEEKEQEEHEQEQEHDPMEHEQQEKDVMGEVKEVKEEQEQKQEHEHEPPKDRKEEKDKEQDQEKEHDPLKQDQEDQEQPEQEEGQDAELKGVFWAWSENAREFSKEAEEQNAQKLEEIRTRLKAGRLELDALSDKLNTNCPVVSLSSAERDYIDLGRKLISMDPGDYAFEGIMSHSQNLEWTKDDEFNFRAPEVDLPATEENTWGPISEQYKKRRKGLNSAALGRGRFDYLDAAASGPGVSTQTAPKGEEQLTPKYSHLPEETDLTDEQRSTHEDSGIFTRLTHAFDRKYRQAKGWLRRDKSTDGVFGHPQVRAYGTDVPSREDRQAPYVPPLASTHSSSHFSSIMPYISRRELPNDQNDIRVYIPSQVKPAGANPLEAPPAPMAVIVSPTGARSVSHGGGKSLSWGINDAVQTEVFILRSSTELIGN